MFACVLSFDKKFDLYSLIHSGENEYQATYDSIVFVLEKLYMCLIACYVFSSVFDIGWREIDA